MTEKLTTIRKILESSTDNQTKLKIIRFQGVFNCLLLHKLYESQQLKKIEVSSLEKNHPDYEHNIVFTINLKDNGLIGIEKL